MVTCQNKCFNCQLQTLKGDNLKVMLYALKTDFVYKEEVSDDHYATLMETHIDKIFKTIIRYGTMCLFLLTGNDIFIAQFRFTAWHKQCIHPIPLTCGFACRISGNFGICNTSFLFIIFSSWSHDKQYE